MGRRSLKTLISNLRGCTDSKRRNDIRENVIGYKVVLEYVGSRVH